jgi:photosystem II stability/assembly factor-like uncharacterized protein
MSQHLPLGRRRLGARLLPAASIAFVLLLATGAGIAKIAASDPSAQNSEVLPRAAHSLLLDLVATPTGYFAVGERGHVLHSADGAQWDQAKVPTRSTLTAVAAVGDQLWAAGHDGVIVHSADGGKTWTAQRRDPFDPSIDPNQRDPRQGAPILDLLFTDATHGYAVGAYSLMLETTDGGATWTPKDAVAPAEAPAEPAAPMQGDVFSAADLELDEESDPHFNAIADAGNGTLVVVGERGTVLRSDDAGATWRRMAFPYKGSMFGVLALGNGRLLAFGLRGNAFESPDLGATWTKVPAQGSASWMGGTALADGGAVLVGANGSLLVRDGASGTYRPMSFRNAAGEMPALAGVAADGKGGYVLVGDKGAERMAANDGKAGTESR